MKKFTPSFYRLCASTTFLSAFLLFQIQPLISKHILPWFGGGAMVWITALFFFMFILLIGYIYVLIISFYSLKFQKRLHSLIILIVNSLLLYHYFIWDSSITPLFSEQYLSSNPIIDILYLLSLSIWAPFFLLSTTSSLLQLWYGNSTGKEPFSLYAISNIGSLLGLLSYPFLFEPIFSTTMQGTIWTSFFFLYSTFLFLILVKTRFLPADNTKEISSESFQVRSMLNTQLFLKWIWVASIPVMVMLTSTSYISGFIASMPFIWIIPLALYLVSFIVSFRWGDRTVGSLTLLGVFFVSIIGISLISFSHNITIPVILLVLWMSVYIISHYCHEWLYENRPIAIQLPWFYVALSIGGVFGSSLVLLSTLFILKSPLEYLYILIGMMILSLYQLYHFSLKEYDISRRQVLLLWVICIIVIGFLISSQVDYSKQIIAQERNFYGSKKILENTNSEGKTYRSITHEMTTHGFEYTDDENKGQPNSYYTSTSGLGRMMQYIKQKNHWWMDVAVIGLWAWIINTYCWQNDSFIFFEIDQEVYDLAQWYFTFLDHCKEKEIKIWDARKLLWIDEKNNKKYDIIIIDAYSDDAVPAHLITSEAAKLYLSLLKQNGIIAIHISSRYLDLLPVISGLTQDNSLFWRFYKDTSPSFRGSPSLWTLLTKDTTLFSAQEFDIMKDISTISPVLWTDTKNALWPIVRIWNE